MFTRAYAVRGLPLNSSLEQSFQYFRKDGSSTQGMAAPTVAKNLSNKVRSSELAGSDWVPCGDVFRGSESVHSGCESSALSWTRLIAGKRNFGWRLASCEKPFDTSRKRAWFELEPSIQSELQETAFILGRHTKKADITRWCFIERARSQCVYADEITLGDRRTALTLFGMAAGGHR